MKKNTLFILRTFNDIDHITPLLWYAMEKNQRVIILWLGNDDINSYKIIAELIKKNSIKVISINHNSQPIKFLSWNLFSSLFFLKTNSVERIVSEWFNPSWKDVRGHLFIASRILGIKTFALPHGYFVFTNDSINFLKKTTETTKDFSNRNKFHRYYLNNQYHKDIFLERGLNKNICRINGNMRFSKKWHQKLTQNYFVNEGPKTKIIFFTPHWSYNVFKVKTLKLLDELINRFTSDEFKIIEHTRGSGSLDNSLYSNYIMHNKSLSGQIIKNTDIIISFGSSIIFEAILQEKHVVNPIYLHTNQTIFDQYDSIHNTKSYEETIDAITALTSSNKEVNNKEYQHIIQQHIYLNKHEEPIISFYDQIFSQTN